MIVSVQNNLRASVTAKHSTVTGGLMKTVSARVMDVEMTKVQPASTSDSREDEFTNYMFARSTWSLAFGGIYPGDVVQRYRKTVGAVIAASLSIFSAFLVLLILNCYYKTTTTANLLLQSSGNVQTLLNALVCSLTISKDIKRLKKHVNNYQKRYGFCANVAKIKRYITLATLVSLMIILGKVAVIAFDLQPYHLNSVWLSESPWIYVDQCVAVLTFTIGIVQIYGFCILTTSMLYILWCEFMEIDEKLRNLVKSDDPRVEEITDTLTSQHESLAKILSQASTCSQFFNFNILFLTLIWNGVYLYVTVSQSVSIRENIYIWAGITWALVCIVGLLLIQAHLASKAQTPLRYLWMLNKNRLSDRGLLKLNLWVSRLTADPIAYNIYGFITINFPMLTATLGTVVTYVFVVLQFGSPGGAQYQMPTGNNSFILQ